MELVGAGAWTRNAYCAVTCALHNFHIHVDTWTHSRPPLSETLCLKDPRRALSAPSSPIKRRFSTFTEQVDSVANGSRLGAPTNKLPPEPCGSVHAGTKRWEEGGRTGHCDGGGGAAAAPTALEGDQPHNGPTEERKGAVFARAAIRVIQKTCRALRS